MMNKQQLYLLISLAKRDFASRFKGAALGLLWAIFTPLFTLAVYYFAFGVVFKVRWQSMGFSSTGTEPPSVLIMFTGLIFFNFFAECLTRAPSLYRENPNYIKKVIFPLELLPIVVIITAAVNACISLVLLTILYIALVGLPGWQILLLPAVFLPLLLGGLGGIYALASLGVYVPDLKNIVTPLSMVFMFLTPIFYPEALVPEQYHWVFMANPLAGVIKQARMLLFTNEFPSLLQYAALLFCGVLLCLCGYLFFKKLRKGFCDVL